MKIDLRNQPAELTQLMDEHHLVALSDRRRARARFGQELQSFLQSIPETQVIAIRGIEATSLSAFCEELARNEPRFWGIEPTWPAIVAALRDLPAGPKRRYFLWHDADVMLEEDVQLFSRLVNILCAIAAEHEHLRPGTLILHRVLFTGASKLGAYAEDERSQFSQWLLDDEAGLWEVFSCVDRPPVLIYRIDG